MPGPRWSVFCYGTRVIFYFNPLQKAQFITGIVFFDTFAACQVMEQFYPRKTGFARWPLIIGISVVLDIVMLAPLFACRIISLPVY